MNGKAMRVGFATSVAGHLILLAWGLVTLPSAQPFEASAVDALPVDLIDITDVTNIAEGTKAAPKKDTASQAKVQNPVPRPESQKAGKAPEDQDTPVTEKTTETAAAPTKAPPPPPPAAKPPAPEKPPEPVEKAEPAPPEPEPEPAPAPKEAPPPAPKTEPAPPKAEVAELPAEPAEPAEAAPAPVPPSAKPRQKPKPPQEVAAAEPSRDTEPEDKPVKEKTPAKPVKPSPDRKPDAKTFDPTELAALLNKVDPSGGGGRSSEEEASLGSETRTGPVANMSQSEIDALRAAIEACWNPPVGTDGLDGMMVPIRVEFNMDGSLAAEPIAREIPPGPVGQIMAEAALRAVRRCAPYSFLPPEKYESWQVVNINFRPPAMF